MRELRVDYLTGTSVVIAPERKERPMGFAYGARNFNLPKSACPFCPENEHLTPGVVAKLGQVRSVPNMYPAFGEGSGLAFGYHEVIIDTDGHIKNLHELAVSEISDTFMMMKERYLEFVKDKRIKQVQAFKNVGLTSGASIPHSHWQIVGMPFVPILHTTIISNFTKYKAETGKCYLCEKYENAELIIYKNEGAVSYIPFASQFSHMFEIVPKAHISNLGQLTKEISEALGDALKTSLDALLKLLPNLDYNVLIYSAPPGTHGRAVNEAHDQPHEQNNSDWHLFLQVIPRLGFMAGYELLTGCSINSIVPEETAVKMKDIIQENITNG